MSLTRRQRCALLACDHALDHELPVRPLTVGDYFGTAVPEAGATHPAQTQPLAAFLIAGAARRGLSSHSLAELPPSVLRCDDTGFAPGCLI